MLDIIKALRELGASEVSLDHQGRVLNVKFSHSVILPPTSEEAEIVSRRTMVKPEDERLQWYKAVAGVSE